MRWLVLLLSLAMPVVSWFSQQGAFGATNGAISDQYPTLIVAAGYAFAIWGLIFLWDVAFGVWQAFSRQAAAPPLARIRPWAAAGFALTAIWMPAIRLVSSGCSARPAMMPTTPAEASRLIPHCRTAPMVISASPRVTSAISRATAMRQSQSDCAAWVARSRAVVMWPAHRHKNPFRNLRKGFLYGDGFDDLSVQGAVPQRCFSEWSAKWLCSRAPRAPVSG